MIITLTPDQVAWSNQAGLQRQEENHGVREAFYGCPDDWDTALGYHQRGCRGEHAACILQRCRGEHLQPRDMGEPSFERMRMLGCELLARSGRHADDHRHTESPAGHMPDRGGGVQDLVERQQ